MMDFEEFKNSVAENIRDFLPEQYADADISLKEITKNNDIRLTGLMIRTEESNIAPNLYLEGYFEQYQDGRNIAGIMQDIADARVWNEVAKGFDEGRLTDFNQVKDRIICRLVNAEMNTDYLADKPHMQIEDLAVMYAIDLGDGAAGHMTAPITEGLLARYGIGTEELHNIALHNLSESHIEFKSMRDVLAEMMFPDGMPENDPMAAAFLPEEETPSMYILSNAEKTNGAAAVLDSTTMEDIAEKLGGDFVVIPSSIHEVIVLPVTEGMDRQNIEDVIQIVNAEQVAPEERLSEHAYQYDSREHELVRMDKMEERQQQRAGERDNVKPDVKDGNKQERGRVSMKDKLPEKKAEAAKMEMGRNRPVPSKTRDAAALA